MLAGALREAAVFGLHLIRSRKSSEALEQEQAKSGSHLGEDLVLALVRGSSLTWWESLLGAAKGGGLRC